MGTVTLESIIATPLRRISTQGGDVLHAMRHDDVGYSGFGEAYFSTIDSGAIKAWKCHTRMTMNLVVPIGQVRFVFCLAGQNDFRVEEIGADRYMRLTVPPGIWFGFKGVAQQQSLVLNLADIAHSPDEVERCLPTEIEYEW